MTKIQINHNKLLDVRANCIEIKAQILETVEDEEIFGGKAGDYAVFLPEGSCIVLKKKVFEMIFQTSQPIFCQQCAEKEEKLQKSC